MDPPPPRSHFVKILWFWHFELSLLVAQSCQKMSLGVNTEEHQRCTHVMSVELGAFSVSHMV